MDAQTQTELSTEDLDRVSGGDNTRMAYPQPCPPPGPYNYPYPYPCPAPYPYWYQGPWVNNPNYSPGPVLLDGKWHF